MGDLRPVYGKKLGLISLSQKSKLFFVKMKQKSKFSEKRVYKVRKAGLYSKHLPRTTKAGGEQNV